MWQVFLLMEIFNHLFVAVYKHYKTANNKKATRNATIYISVLQCALLLLLGVFFVAFAKQMHVSTIAREKLWFILVLAIGFIFLKNWLQYTGRKTKVLQAKMLKSNQKQNIYLLWFLPIACMALAIILYQAI